MVSNTLQSINQSIQNVLSTTEYYFTGLILMKHKKGQRRQQYFKKKSIWVLNEAKTREDRTHTKKTLFKTFCSCKPVSLIDKNVI